MDITIEKNKKTLYEGSLNVNMDGKIYNFRVDSSMPFKNPEDAVSHLFTHFKEKMSKQHQK
jgi:hypothetical protein